GAPLRHACHDALRHRGYRARILRVVQRRTRRRGTGRGSAQGAGDVSGRAATMRDMQDELRQLYQEVIFDHNRRPRNFHEMEHANHVAQGHNPLCGDELTVYVQTEGGVVRDVSFVGQGCAISKASASLMTEAVVGKSEAEVEA